MNALRPEYAAGFVAGLAAAAEFLTARAPRPHDDAPAGSITRIMLDLATMLRDHAANVGRAAGGKA